MGFIDDENSPYFNTPIEGYVITAGTSVYYFTNQPVGDAYDGVHTYTPVEALKRRNITRKNVGASGGELEVSMARYALGNNVIGYPPDPFLIVITRYQPDGSQKIFDGEVTNAKLQGTDVVLRCVGKMEARMGKRVPSLIVVPQCSRTLYDSWCRVTRASQEHATTVTAVSSDGLLVTVADRLGSVSWYTYGEMHLGSERRTIVRQDPNSPLVMQLNYPFNATVSGSIKIYPGCDKLIGTCTSKFSNRQRFQGAPFQPIDDIYKVGIDGVRVY